MKSILRIDADPWSIAVPVLACVVLGVAWGGPLGWVLLPLVCVALVTSCCSRCSCSSRSFPSAGTGA